MSAWFTNSADQSRRGSSKEDLADPSHKSKTAARLALWKGFSSEFEKLAMLPPTVAKAPTSLADTAKVVSTQRASLMLRKPNFSRPHRAQVNPLGPLASPIA